MSKIKGCKRCKYDKTIYDIDYQESAMHQVICYKEIKVCSKCNYIRPSKNFIYNEAALDNYPKDMNVDLSKIIHEHNHNIQYTKEYTKYNKKGICIKLTLIKYYKCDFCNKKMNKFTEINKFTEFKDIYDKIEYKIDYEKSAQEQKIYYTIIKSCSESKQVEPIYENKIVELNNYPSYINADLSKIIHEHNHNEFHFVEEKPTYDLRNNCIELILINHYKCDFCDKPSDYTEIKEKYDLNNPCERMNELTKKYKEAKYNSIYNKYDDYEYRDNDYESGASYDRKGGHYYSYHGEWISGY